MYILNCQNSFSDKLKVFLIWLEEVVNGFVNKPLSHPSANFLEDYFMQSKEDIVASGKCLMQMNVQAAQVKFFKTLMTGLTNSNVGKYLVIYKNVLYQYGVHHPKLVCLSYK